VHCALQRTTQLFCLLYGDAKLQLEGLCPAGYKEPTTAHVLLAFFSCMSQAPQAILVGNAVQELKQWAQQQQQQQQQQEQDASVQRHVVYIATEPVAAGVMEGLHALGLLQTQLPY
jgi:ABC-type antimicrobial peptide transport system ATPase subunit